MPGFRVEPAVLEREGAAQLDRAQELGNAANRLRGLAESTGESVTEELDVALNRFVDVWSWTVDRMVDTTDGIGNAVRTSAYTYTWTDIALGTVVGGSGIMDALFLTPDYRLAR